MTGGDEPNGVAQAFERESIVLALTQLSPLKIMRPGTKESNKYKQILTSVRAVGLVEPPVVIGDRTHPDRYFLLDGHLRVEALKDLGITEIECLVATDDDTYSYNKRINRIPPIQEHRMIQRAIERGVSKEKIAAALGLGVHTIQQRTRLLEGICPDAVALLQDAACPAGVFHLLRRMASVRQVEAAELMVGQGNFTTVFAKAILAATPDAMLVDPRKKKPGVDRGVSGEQIARMEREIARLQMQVKSVEETYGIDNLHLTVARGYVRKLLGNARVVRWLTQHRQEYLTEFQAVAELEGLMPATSAAE
ncbi:MAG: ParB N-terminal domain-containing protein [Thermoanaerobaculia bacterium]|nr:ParB N-terminal domain-containing protein [Thermoanaerobaculia bacterium]